MLFSLAELGLATSQRTKYLKAFRAFCFTHASKSRFLRPIFNSQRRFLLGRCSPGAASRAIEVLRPQKCSATSSFKKFLQVALVHDLWLLAVELIIDSCFFGVSQSVPIVTSRSCIAC